MYARVTLVELDPMRMSVSAAVDHFRQAVLPELEKQDGYEGSYALATPEGKAMVITFWASRDIAEGNIASGYYESQIAKFGTVFRSPPGRELYDVVLSDVPAGAAR
jgi:heme-degrading monooxygenase HmoA